MADPYSHPSSHNKPWMFSYIDHVRKIAMYPRDLLVWLFVFPHLRVYRRAAWKIRIVPSLFLNFRRTKTLRWKHLISLDFEWLLPSSVGVAMALNRKSFHLRLMNRTRIRSISDEKCRNETSNKKWRNDHQRSIPNGHRTGWRFSFGLVDFLHVWLLALVSGCMMECVPPNETINFTNRESTILKFRLSLLATQQLLATSTSLYAEYLDVTASFVRRVYRRDWQLWLLIWSICDSGAGPPRSTADRQP
jgi:hypothetical protein